MRFAVGLLLAAFGGALGYIPAQGTNDTQQLRLSDVSRLRVKWPNGGFYSDEVSYRLARANSSGFEIGALVHFNEDKLIEGDLTNTPWVALISCDKNSTNAPKGVDIFTAARDRGAVAALLYSMQSEACSINHEYTDSFNDNHILDIFATKTKSSARLAESKFSAVNTAYWSFDSKKLNESYQSVMNVVNGLPNHSLPFLISVLTAYNATSSLPGGGTSDKSPHNSPNEDNGNSNTSPGMIVLYAIIACVAILFCAVILGGVIRVIRHPERYGPRSGNPNVNGPSGAPQTRAAGLTRAILDTFPVVKFGRSPASGMGHNNEGKNYDMKGLEMEHKGGGYGQEAAGLGGTVRHVEEEAGVGAETRQLGSASPRLLPPRADEVTRAAIGVETCPICIVDFEDGDDLRVLPCEGRHRFHRNCVDQWLLKLSSSCPLCREDFAALQAMVAGNNPQDAPTERAYGQDGPSANQFSKYLRFAQRRRRDRNHGQSI